MPARDEIIRFLDDFLDKDLFRDYCPIGLQVEGDVEVNKVATAVSACAETFIAAAEWGADMLLVHHGLFWDKASPVLRGHQKRRIQFLLEHGLTLVAYHLPLDAHREVGNNALFAQAMGWTDPRPWGDYHGHLIGWRGDFEPTPIQDFVNRARDFYSADPMALLHGEDEITSAAVISGGAWEFVRNAAIDGIDCFVTGNADEPAYHIAREEGMHFLAFGHNITERVGIRRLGEVVADEFGIEERFFDVDNPL
jgi:dinuclear metal center YbgI/SA1388 family protein